MTQREAIEYYQGKVIPDGNKSDDSPLEEGAILRDIKSTLVLFKQRALKSNDSQSLNEFDIITLPCVELEEVDIVDCPDIPESGFTWLKTKKYLPRPIKIESVTDILGFEKFGMVTWDSIDSMSNIRLKPLRKKVFYTWRNIEDKTYIYLKSPKKLEAIAVTMMPEDYYEALIFPKCGEVNAEAFCNPLDTEIGASASMIMQVVDYLTKGVKVPADFINNDNPIQ